MLIYIRENHGIKRFLFDNENFHCIILKIENARQLRKYTIFTLYRRIFLFSFLQNVYHSKYNEIFNNAH
jgi:hypothetical protein